MKRPSKKPQLVKNQDCYLDLDIDYSPMLLREIADKMEKDGIIHIRLEDSGHESYVECISSRKETPEETELRYRKEKKSYDKYRKSQKEINEKRKESLKKEAKKLGLKIVD